MGKIVDGYIEFDLLTIGQLIEKCGAFEALLGSAPRIFVSGVFLDESGDLVFLQYSRYRVYGIEKQKFLQIEIPDQAEMVLAVPLGEKPQHSFFLTV